MDCPGCQEPVLLSCSLLVDPGANTNTHWHGPRRHSPCAPPQEPCNSSLHLQLQAAGFLSLVVEISWKTCGSNARASLWKTLISRLALFTNHPIHPIHQLAAHLNISSSHTLIPHIQVTPTPAISWKAHLWWVRVIVDNACNIPFVFFMKRCSLRLPARLLTELQIRMGSITLA